MKPRLSVLLLLLVLQKPLLLCNVSPRLIDSLAVPGLRIVVSSDEFSRENLSPGLVLGACDCTWM